MGWWVAVAVVVVAGAVLAACAGSPGHLGADRRVKILDPEPGATVSGPLTIRWSSTFEPGDASGLWFVVYLDAAQVAPNTSALVAATEPCDSVHACLAKGAIAGPNVFLTDAHEVDASALPMGAGTEHRLMIVLVDAQGVRSGGVAWTASFRYGA